MLDRWAAFRSDAINFVQRDNTPQGPFEPVPAGIFFRNFLTKPVILDRRGLEHDSEAGGVIGENGSVIPRPKGEPHK
jgi:hypothetical protein